MRIPSAPHMSLIKQIQKISKECVKLKNKYVPDKNLKIDWVCVFSQNDKEYKSLIEEAESIGTIIETAENGLVYRLIKPIKTSAGTPKLLKIRKYDPTRPEMGDVDFTTQYKEFKRKYLNNERFTLIKKERFEMIELRDISFDARVYFSSIPPSKLRGIS